MSTTFVMGLYVLILAAFLGAVLIARVPATLHTPLMSATNMISGIVLLGCMIVLGSVDAWWLEALAFLGVVAAMANVVGGFYVTDRMLGMFRPRQTPSTADEAETKR